MAAFLKYWWPAIVALLALAVAVVAITLVVPVVKEGSAARRLQVKLAPASCKRYVANYREGVWNLSDLRLVVRYSPAPCTPAERILARHWKP